MKNLIEKALDEAKVKLGKRTPLMKKQTETISIMDVSPIDLREFMKDNNVPDDAEFDGRDNGYDAWDDIQLSWNIDVPTTDKDKTDHDRRVFTTIAFKLVFI